MTVLVAAATKHGATGEIADRIGADLAEVGLDVDVLALNDVRDVSGYQAVVLGSAIFYGTWMKQARAFVDAHADELAARPTWLFASGSVTGDPPRADDPNAIRPSLVDKLLTATHAREHKLFAGKLDPSTLNLAEKLPIHLVRARDGDWRDWKAIDEWATTIANQLAEHNTTDTDRPETTGQPRPPEPD
jgi:menaquinone-dependent protoporphyrinogen oxidase